MEQPVYTPDYAYEAAPDPGETVKVADGVHWLRMPLPFKLDHINLWLLDDSDKDGDGWAIVDTGINRDEVKAAWESVFEGRFTEAKPLKRVIVTHFHPDHLESVRKVYAFKQSFLIIRRIDAKMRKARAVLVRFSKSLARRRHLPSQANVLSTTHLLGMTSKPIAVSDRLTISVSKWGKIFFWACSKTGP